jgi:hypothetical protein
MYFTLLASYRLGAHDKINKWLPCLETCAQSVLAQLRDEAKYESAMTSLTLKLSHGDRGTILRGQETGQWLSVLPSAVNGAELSAQKFRDALLLRHARGPPGPPPLCDGCNQKFSARRARHNEIRDELSDLAFKALPHPQFATNPKSTPVAARK